MGLAEALGPLTPHMKRPASALGNLDAQTPKRPDAQTPKAAGLPLQGTAKRSHPDFVRKTLYVRKATMRDAMRRYEDAGGVEESELVELLLREYVRGVLLNV